MGSDLFALSALAKELDKKLKGAKIDKIQQPEVDELRLFVRNNFKNDCLCISCNAGAPRIHFTSMKKQSPKTAPNLLMLLRKYISNGIIEGVKIFNNDRILEIKINAKTEMRDDATFFIFVEIMNRYSNIVFTDENLIILDAVKHLPLDIARDHVVLRGIKYAPVGQNKTSYLTDCFDVIDKYSNGDIHKYILDNISGFSGTTVSEILYRASVKSDAMSLSSAEKNRIKDVLDYFKNLDKITPCIIDGKDVYPIVYESLKKDDNIVFFESMSDAYDFINTDCDKAIRNKARLKTLSSTANRLIKKIEKNIAIDLNNLKDCEDMEKYRIFGELIVANIYKIKKGDEVLDCINYYTNESVSIPLDKMLSPSKNSTAYYNKYNKLKRTKEFAIKKLEQDRELLEYVKSIEQEIATLPYESDSAPIEQELDMLGGNRKKSVKKERNPKQEPPYIYKVDDFYIYRGKNNIQNDELTFKIASSNDTWLHLKAEHGAHTIIQNQGRPIPDKVLKIACEITASTKGASCDVDYTQRKNVKRKPSSHPGQVIYVNYKTIHAEPDSHLEYLIKS